MFGISFYIVAAVMLMLPNTMALSPPDLVTPIELEWGRNYTEGALQLLVSEARAAQNQTTEDTKRGLVEARLVQATDYLAINTQWTCPYGGQFSRSMRIRIVGSILSNYVSADYYSELNVDYFSPEAFEQKTTAHLPSQWVSSAIHNFCLNYGNVICSYHWVQNFEGKLQLSGHSTNLDDGPDVLMTETCFTVTGGACGGHTGTANRCYLRYQSKKVN